MTFSNELLPEEVQILRRLTGLPVNLPAMTVVTNIYRAAQRMKARQEREVLTRFRLSWNGFALLYNLWIWGPMETRALAQSVGLSRATVSSIVDTLERHGLCRRQVNPADRRLVSMHLTEKAQQIMEELYPRFNQGEVTMVSGLTVAEQQLLADLLRRVIRNL